MNITIKVPDCKRFSQVVLSAKLAEKKHNTKIDKLTETFCRIRRLLHVFFGYEVDIVIVICRNDYTT